MGVVIEEVQGVVEPEGQREVQGDRVDHRNRNLERQKRLILSVTNRRNWMDDRINAD